ncbi:MULTISPECIES: metallophosphoesterase [Ureibacillus]|jgi:uncharacterized protein|uniref:metallophosphoesterase n=1 Tax=Ureibacillus TaxID=160795 RepID=UPI00031E85E6|nr:metallophosphoesterase [Ureibacillus thermosphaericus]
MIVLATVLIFGSILSFMVKEAFENNVIHHEISLKGKKEKYTIFFISDIHTRLISDKLIQDINAPINAVIIGGDLADRRTKISTIYRNLHLLKTLGPVYFVWGNNDREVGEERLREIFQETGVQIVENDAVLLPNTENRCWLSAVDDLSSRKAQPEKAFSKCHPEDIVIFVSHNPNLFSKLKDYHADLWLGGHFHGGQIRLGPFGIYPVGSFSAKDGKYTLISNGYGTSMVPLRFGAKPECHIIDLNFHSELQTKG